ncbi:hypothetical protein BR93DRAFT_921924 [Coniochaeta sp. PMI_546]|nr:hypothetical protein BR93DRAFT_921924 [Coniochaeta sp. PMI_546]
MRPLTFAACLALVPAGLSDPCTPNPSATSISPDDALALSQALEAAYQSLAALRASWESDGATIYRFDFKSTTAIADSLERYKLEQWGFVMYRCTYSSQEKWERFVALAKQGARDYFERYGAEDLAAHDKMVWTIFEDAETLDGASILDTSRKFRQWAGTEGRAETVGSAVVDSWSDLPRYLFFIHVDEQSLESVVDDEKARQPGGYFFTVAREDSVMIREASRQAGEIPEDQDPLDEELELLDSRKRFKLGDLVELYGTLLDTDTWYNIYVDLDVGVADVLPGPSQLWTS